LKRQKAERLAVAHGPQPSRCIQLGANLLERQSSALERLDAATAIDCGLGIELIPSRCFLGSFEIIRSIMVEEVPLVGLSFSPAIALLDDAYDTSVHLVVSVEAPLFSRSVA
jgi:hypothetical protein